MKMIPNFFRGEIFRFNSLQNKKKNCKVRMLDEAVCEH